MDTSTPPDPRPGEQRPGLPGPLRRRGPRPLLLHLTLAMLKSSASIGASQPWSSALLRSSARQERAAALLAALAGGDADAFPRAVLRETLRQDRDLIAGIAAYRRHPATRDLPEPPAVWAEGGSTLLHYGGDARGPALLLIPSLINRGYVLDLRDGQSLARYLTANGVRTLLLEWGWPGEAERHFGLTDYIAGRLERVLAEAVRLTRGPVVLAGYCMGGLLTLAAALRRPDLVRALALLATPWDFHAPDAARPLTVAEMLPLLEPAMALSGTVPTDALQTLFALLDPFAIADKYRAFGRLPPDSPRAHMFVALEDWLNDGVPLAAPVAREALGDWYGRNAPALGQWRVAGLPVDPGALRMPCFVAVPGRDRIVPPESARPLAQAIAGSVLNEPAAGHIGMVAGSGAERTLWRPLLDWLRNL